MYAIIAGGGKVGKNVARSLGGMGHEVTLIEQRRDRFEQLEVEFGHAAMLGDATEINTLKRQMENYENRIVPALRKNYETLMLAYEQNKEELPIVIDAWETINMTQMQYLDTVQKYYETITSYEKQLEK